jgi:hypothetical protein
MTEHYVQTVRIESLTPHSNADTLDIATVLGDYPVIVKRGLYKVGDTATYVSVDAMVPVDHPFFEFLAAKSPGKTHHRVRAMKLRGAFSMGLLVPPVLGTAIGQNVDTLLGVLKYTPPEEEALERVAKHATNRKAKPNELASFNRRVTVLCALAGIAAILYLPIVLAVITQALIIVVGLTVADANKRLRVVPNVPIYDIEGFRHHANVFAEGEPVCVTEKLHGSSCRFVHTGRKFHIGSRTMFRSDSGNVWERVAKQYKLEEILKRYPGLVLFGEVYGSKVQDLTYGCAPGEVKFAAFDLMDLKTREYMDPAAFSLWCAVNGVPAVPQLYVGPFEREKVLAMAEGKSTLAGHVREGIVIKPMVETREVRGLGRKVLKYVGQGYLLRKEAA